ncbi:hypothetical protein FRC96_20070 [Lujinxingia vulgaris]|uniref:PilZ domain-containing protein n=1 Tax=Lujinxingia vulgaris TaxID=2600176 RepID=A0A5C6X3M0_9DELT|nr:PilZ domain-containing protein [Lujinxingia vulgaris]TXD31772.1 hypothetical protein FRC96_20070 [Lujinxingia vulgaris]
MSDSNFSAIRARLKFPSIEAFKEGYGRYISAGGMFVPMSPQKLKPVGTTVRFQFLLADGTSALLGEGVVRQIRGMDGGESGPVGMLVKFTKLSPESKALVDEVVRFKTEGSGAHAVEEAEPSEPAEEPASQDEQHTAEAEIPDDLFGAPDEAPESAAASGDEIFGGASEPEIPMPGGLNDPSEAVAAALALGSEPQLVEPPEQPEVPLTPPETASEEAELDSLDDLFGVPDDESEEELVAPAEAEAEPEAIPETTPAPPVDEDRALKRTEGGLKVMAFEGDELAEEAAREFEMFAAAGDDDEIDEMFDNIFGGGGDDDFFGGGGEGGGDVFGGGAESVEAEAPQPPAAPAPAPPAFALDDEADEADDALMADDDDEVFELDSPVDESDSEELLLDEVSDSGTFELDEASDSEELLLDEVSDSEELELGEEPSDVGPNEEILSLLSMDEESEAESELNLSLGAGLAESSATSSDDGEPDSFEALLASAKREIESKKEPEEEKKGDILDELLGDDDLPPAPGAAPTFAVPQPGEKKKKGGFMSKLFGKD